MKTTQKIIDALETLNEAAKEHTSELGELCVSKYHDLRKAVVATEHSLAKGISHGSDRLAALREAATDDVKRAAGKVNAKAHEEPWLAMVPAFVGAFAIGFLVGRKR